MKKNIVIAILVIVAVGQSVLLYRARQFSKTFIVEMLPVVEKQRQVCDDLASQVNWLRRHLGETISALEADHNLEALPVYDPSHVQEEMKIGRPRPPQPFAIAYEKPKNMSYNEYTIDYRSKEGLSKLSCLIETTSLFALNSTLFIEGYIDNFYQRLQRLQPLIETASK